MNSEFAYLDFLNNTDHWYPSPNSFTDTNNEQSQQSESEVKSTSAQISPVFFHLQYSEIQDEISIHDLLDVLLLTLSLSNVLLLVLKDNCCYRGQSQLYLGLAPDAEFTVDPEELENNMYLNQEILLNFFDDTSLGWTIEPVSVEASMRLQNKLNHYRYAACFNGAIGMPDPDHANPKYRILQHLYEHTTFFLVMVLRPITAMQIKELENQTEQLCDNLSILVTRSSSVVHNKSSNCSSGTNISGGITNTNSRSKGTDRREIAIDIYGDEEADFWTKIATAQYLDDIAREDQESNLSDEQNNVSNTDHAVNTGYQASLKSSIRTDHNEVTDNLCDNPEQDQQNNNQQANVLNNNDQQNSSQQNGNQQNDNQQNDNQQNGSQQNNNQQQVNDAITRSRNLSKGDNCIRSASASDSCSSTKSYTCTTSCSYNQVTFNTNAKSWMQYIDNEPYKRYTYGLSHKMYLNNMVLLSDNQCDLQMIGSCISDMMAAHCHFAPYKMSMLSADHNMIKDICHFHIPYSTNRCCNAEQLCRTSLSQLAYSQKQYNGSLLTDLELAFLIGYFVTPIH